MSSSRNHKNAHSFEKSNSEKNARRRELYRLMPSEKKEAILARRQEKRVELKRQCLSINSTNNNLATTSSSVHNTLLMRDPILLSDICIQLK
ncbi:hypothetical protein MTR67_012562 [Solanum verrucosum]|uniref:IBB domain-containing protein n=1 Tax=Solanum verrucosum TaxID=315347 RepID=A0AAF0TG38_SOLVR|nr:hypothetical protein MTR67_012562 [Solanum verrucosum]